jgi:hypothetical protein
MSIYLNIILTVGLLFYCVDKGLSILNKLVDIGE